MAAAKERKVYFENLDGLRFLAAVSVFVFHAYVNEYAPLAGNTYYRIFRERIAQNGDLGVNFFFVLSGFLITYLLLHEKDLKGRINVGAFYMRRVLRIWPLYFLCVFLGFVAMPYVKSLLGMPFEPETAHAIYFLTFLSNYNNIVHGFPTADILGVLWSVAIEEQFYLFWPLLLVLLNRRYYPAFFISLIIVSFGFRLYHLNDLQIQYFHTLSLVTDLCLGALLAYCCFYSEGFKNFFARLPKAIIGLAYLAGFAIIVFRHRIFVGEAYALERLAFSAFFGFVILEQNYAAHSFFKIGRLKLMTQLGKYTYGFYCLHFLGLMAGIYLAGFLHLKNSAFGVLVFTPLVSLVFALVLCYLSFHYFEEYFLKLKNRFSPVRVHKDDDPSYSRTRRRFLGLVRGKKIKPLTGNPGSQVQR